MIRVVVGDGLRRLLTLVAGNARAYRRIVLCSPFVDDDFIVPLFQLAKDLWGGQCGFRIITTLGAARRIRELGQAFDSGDLVSVPALHAKVYLALARRPELTRLLLTSANLTHAGTQRNLELGILASPTSDEGRKVISEATTFLDRLVVEFGTNRSGHKPRRAA